MHAEPRPTRLDPDALDDLQPIGPECGRLLLRLLDLRGWDVYERQGFGGGVLLIAESRRPPLLRAEVRAASLAEGASLLVTECNRLCPPAAA